MIRFLKYGTIIGFADSNITKGQVLTNNNVVFKEFKENTNIVQNIKQQILLILKIREHLKVISVQMDE